MAESKALATAEDLTADLLAAATQRLAESANLSIPRIKVMGAGVGLFEFEDGSTPADFEAVIIHEHDTNVWWDKPFGEGEEDEGPGCRSDDGIIGYPRPGVEHPGLGGDEASEGDTVECRGCPLNEWGSDPKGGKGKACANKKRVYLMIPGESFPFSLDMSPTSVKPFNAYVGKLVSQGAPPQAVLTRFSQKKNTRGTLKWSTVDFEMVGRVEPEVFVEVAQRRQSIIEMLVGRKPVVEEEAPF